MKSIDDSRGDDLSALSMSARCGLIPFRDCVVPPMGGAVQRRDKPRLLALTHGIIIILVIMAALGATATPSRAGEVAPSEAQLKAAFLLNFPKYVEWPPNTFPETKSPIIIGVFGDDAVADEFATMSAGKIVEGRPIKLLRVTAPDQCRGCHVLFISSTQNRKLPEILSAIRGANVLTVGDSEEFFNQGGMINLVRHERRIQLEVNLDATGRTELKISSKLLALATVKGGRK
jgi:hypothetical protein